MRGKKRYYSLDAILTKEAHYNMIIGERSNGKTYASLRYALANYVETGEQFAIIRRWQDDFRGKRSAVMFEAISANGEVEKLTGGKWTGIYYYAGRWYLCRFDEKGERVQDEKPFCYAFALSQMEHDKSTSYPEITIVIFDEFMTRGAYLPDEFVIFMNVLSTIIRDRNNVKIFMLGNTVNKYCPYFQEMGLTHIKEMKQGEIDVYTYGESGLKVAVEFSDSPQKYKESDLYFAFDNPKLNMITGRGSVWEIAVYPHKPFEIQPKDIVFTFFIIFNGETLQCEVITKDSNNIIFIHRKTTPLKQPDTDLIYSPDYDPRPNWRRKINTAFTPLEKRISELFAMDKIFYQDNEVGEIVRNYLIWCGKKTI